MTKHSLLQRLIKDGREYLKRCVDLCRLELVDKLSLILGLLFAFLVLSFLLLVAIGYFSVAIVSILATCVPTWAACCIVGGVFVLLTIVVYLCRKALFINPLVRFFSRILFHSNERKEDSHEATA